MKNRTIDHEVYVFSNRLYQPENPKEKPSKPKTNEPPLEIRTNGMPHARARPVSALQ